MKNPMHSPEWSFVKVILALWVIFSLLYVINDVKQNVVVGIYKTGIEAGQKQGQEQGVKIGQRAAAQEIIVQLINMGQRCEPINIYAGEGEARQDANLLGTQCEAPGIAKPGYTIPEPPVTEEEEEAVDAAEEEEKTEEAAEATEEPATEEVAEEVKEEKTEEPAAAEEAAEEVEADASK